MDHFEVFLSKCYEGNLSAVTAFLSEGISPDVQNGEGETALQISAANGYFDIAKLLINKGATIDLPNSYGWTPLMHAARHGHFQIVSLLIEGRAKVNVSNRLGLRPIDLAAWSGNLVCVKLIIDAGAIIDTDKSLSVVQSVVQCDISPLIAASLQGHDLVVRTLLENGSAVNQASPITGFVPLMLAAYGGYKSTVEILIEFGGDANITDICGRTALDLANIECREDVIMFLEDLTQPSSRKSSSGIPVDINILRIVRSGDVAQVKLLLHLNQSLCNYSDSEDGVTPLMTACMLGLNNIVDLLISNGADLNAQDITNGWTPLMYAVFHRQTETVHLLLDKGVDIDICTANGYTALDLAIHTDSSENNILNTLLAYTDSDELLDTTDNLEASSSYSTIKQSHLAVEKIHSRGDSQPRFRELLGGLSSHLRQFSKSSAISPTPDSDIFDETLYDVFDDDITEVSAEKNFLCLSKFYAPNQRFAHLVKEQVVEAICLPPLPSPKNSVDLGKTLLGLKNSKNVPVKSHFNSLRVPNLLRKIKSNFSVHPSHIPRNYILSESLGVKDEDFPTESINNLNLNSSLQNFEFQKNNSEVTSSISECTLLKGYPESQKASEDPIKLNLKDTDLHNKGTVENATGGLTALLSEGSLGKYAKKFRDQEIDLECFQYLTEDDLDEMGISSFDSRNKLMEIIHKLKNN